MSGIGSRTSSARLSLAHFIKIYRSHLAMASSSRAPIFEHESLIMRRGLHLVNGNSGPSSAFGQKGVSNVSKNNKIKPAADSSNSRFYISTWARWLVGSILSLLIPFCKQKWDKFQRIEGEAEVVVEEVERVAEEVERVAKITEKLSTEIADELPKDGKLKEVALYVEHVSENIAHDAHSTVQIIQKVETLKHDYDSIKAMTEPAMEKIIQPKNEG